MFKGKWRSLVLLLAVFMLTAAYKVLTLKHYKSLEAPETSTIVNDQRGEGTCSFEIVLCAFYFNSYAA